MTADALVGVREPRDLVEPALRARVQRLSASMRGLVEYHFGWRDRHGNPTSAGFGKAMRASLVLLCAQAVGGTVERALPAAVAVELVHNASLLHDDVLDHDPLRRGRAALWTVEGIPAAILAGDALFFAAVQVLADTPDAARLVPMLVDSVQTMIEGEYRDTSPRDTSPPEADRPRRLVSVAAAKTGALLACACALGAAAAGAAPERVERMHGFGMHLGIAFQCVDDLLGIYGQEAVTGKPAQSDLRERKMSIPVAAALGGDTPQAAALRALYRGSGPLGESDCRRAAELIEQAGGRADTQRLAEHHLTAALDQLARTAPEPAAAGALTTLAQRILHRDQ